MVRYRSPKLQSVQKNDYTLAELMKIFSASPKIKPKLYQKKIESAWLEVAGPWISKETHSIRLQEHTLIIRVNSAALRQELHFSKEKILERVNDQIGEEYVTDVVVL